MTSTTVSTERSHVNEKAPPKRSRTVQIKEAIPGAGLTVLKVAQIVAEQANTAGAPAAAVASVILKEIIDICESARAQKERFKAIATRAGDFVLFINDRLKMTTGTDAYEKVKETLDKFDTSLKFVRDMCDKYKDKSLLKYIKSALLNRSKISGRLDECETKIREALEDFMLDTDKLIIDMLQAIDERTKNILENTVAIEGRQEEQRVTQVEFGRGQSAIAQRTEDIHLTVNVTSGKMAELNDDIQYMKKGFDDTGFETMLKNHPARAYRIMEALDNGLHKQLTPEQRFEFDSMVQGLLRADSEVNDLIDMKDRVVLAPKPVRGIKGPFIYKGYEKIGETEEKYWVRKIDHPLGLGKITDEKAHRRILQEVRIGRGERDDNIMSLCGYFVRSHDFKIHAFTVAKGDGYVQLDSYLEDTKKNPFGLLKQLASGLKYLHASTRRIVHGDVRCQNVLVTKDGIVKLSEFSVAAIITELSEEDEDNTHQRTRLGALDSVWWQSPAIALGNGLVTVKADIWSFAVTVIECLSIFEDKSSHRSPDQHPFSWFRSETQFTDFLRDNITLSRKTLPYEHKPISDYAVKWGTEDLWQIIDDGLALDPNDRPSIVEVYDRIVEIKESFEAPIRR